MYWKKMLKSYFYFVQFHLKNQSCEEDVKDESFEEKPNIANYAFFFLLFCVIVKIFLENCRN